MLEKMYHDILKLILFKIKIDDIRSLKLTCKKFKKFIDDNCYLIPSKNYIQEININFTTLNTSKQFSNDKIIIKYCGYCGWNKIIKNINKIKLSDFIEKQNVNLIQKPIEPIGYYGPKGVPGPTNSKEYQEIIGNFSGDNELDNEIYNEMCMPYIMGQNGKIVCYDECPVKCEICKDEYCKKLIQTIINTKNKSYKNYCGKCIKKI